MSYNKKFNIRTESMADFGLEPAEQTLIKSVYYAEAHVTDAASNPYKVLTPNQFWRDEVRSLKADWAKERADWAKKEAKMLAEINQRKADAKNNEALVAKLKIGIARAAGDVDRLKKENKILRKVAVDLSNRVKGWQSMAKNLFRKNRRLEIEAICKECEVDEAYDRIRELEEELAEKDVIIDEIIASAEEAAEDWAKAAETAESKVYRLEAELKAETHKLDHMTRAWKSACYELSETKEALARYRRKLSDEYLIGDALEQKNTLLVRENIQLKEEKQVLIDENEYLNDLLYSHREIIWRHEDVQKVAKQQPLLYDLSQQLQLAAEMSAYINHADKMDVDFKDIKVDIFALDTKDELISTIGYVLDELSDLEFLLQAEQKAEEIEDRLDEIEDVCNRILYPFQLCE